MNQLIPTSELAEAKEKLNSGLEELFQLRPLPAVAIRIMNSCREQNVKVHDLVRMIECEPTICSRVLSMVNSSMFGFSRDIDSINQAVVVLGFKQLSQLAITIASEKVFSEGDVAIQPRLRLYEHSLGCAAVSRLLAGRAQTDIDTGAAFLAGMLHDVGKLIFFDVAPTYYTELHDSNLATIEHEQQAFGFDHANLGKTFGEIWGLPSQIQSAIANHHQIDDSTDPLAQMIALANELAKNWGVGQSATPTTCPVAIDWLESASPETCEELHSQSGEQFEELRSMLRG